MCGLGVVADRVRWWGLAPAVIGSEAQHGHT